MDHLEKAIFKIIQISAENGCTVGELKIKILSENPDLPPNSINNT
jgi:hypothetical protein